MSFTQKIIGPDEKLIGISGVHWIYGLIGILWLVGLTVLGLFLRVKGLAFFSAYTDGEPLKLIAAMNVVFGIFSGIGVIFFVLYSIMMLSTEVSLTTKRIIYKRGLFFVDVKEEDIEEVKGVNIDHGLFGRFLDYGYLHFDARFVKDVQLPAVAKPYRLVKALNALRSKQQKDSMTLIVDGREGQAQEQVQADIEQAEAQRRNTRENAPAPASKPEVEDLAPARTPETHEEVPSQPTVSAPAHSSQAFQNQGIVKPKGIHKRVLREDIKERFDLSSD